MAKRVRIMGLVRVAEGVRRELSGPLTARRRERLREQVGNNLRQVREILERNRAGVDHLPAPSRRAFQFLADLDWTKLPAGASGGSAAYSKPQTTLAWRGLSGFIDRALDRLALDQTPAELTSLGQSILRMSRQIELTIRQKNVPPEGLSPTTRLQRGWLAYLATSPGLEKYVAARRRANQILESAAQSAPYIQSPLTVHFRPISAIYKLRYPGGKPVLWLATPMIAFDDPAFAALGELIFQRKQDSRQRVLDSMTGELYQSLRAELEALGGIVEQTQGAAHDLGLSFDRVNTQYFAGKMARPRLTWNRTFTGRKFGHYDWVLDTVMVSRTLDSPRVPEFVVDFLVFHELLHKFHGIHWTKGRGYAHTAEFYASERKFKNYKEAENVLKRLALGTW